MNELNLDKFPAVRSAYLEGVNRGKRVSVGEWLTNTAEVYDIAHKLEDMARDLEELLAGQCSKCWGTLARVGVTAIGAPVYDCVTVEGVNFCRECALEELSKLADTHAIAELDY